MKHSKALRGTSPLRLLSRFSVFGIATLLCGIATTLPSHADLQNFDSVLDAFPPDEHGAYGSTNGIFDWLHSGSAPAAATSTTVTFSAWDRPGAPHASELFQDNRYPSNPNPTAGTRIATLSTLEDLYTSTFSYAASTSGPMANVVTKANSYGTQNTNGFCTYREFRIAHGGTAPIGPTELIYNTLTEGGTFSSLPGASDPTNGQSGVGFEGYTTPRSKSAGIYRVYIALRKNVNGSYWNGSAWTDRREKFMCSLATDTTKTNGRVKWTQVGAWPTSATDLPNGSYSVRTMSQEGSATGPGLLNTLTFKIMRPSTSSVSKATSAQTVKSSAKGS